MTIAFCYLLSAFLSFFAFQSFLLGINYCFVRLSHRWDFEILFCCLFISLCSFQWFSFFCISVVSEKMFFDFFYVFICSTVEWTFDNLFLLYVCIQLGGSKRKKKEIIFSICQFFFGVSSITEILSIVSCTVNFEIT